MDVIFTCGCIALLAAVALPTLHATRERDAAVMAARQLAATMNGLRVEAVRRNRVVSMRFDPVNVGVIASYVDGDGDGVTQHDVDSGMDRALQSARALSERASGVRLYVPLTVPAPDMQTQVTAGSDPVRLGNTNFLSFTPLGTATSGTIYIAGRDGTQVCVRVFGATGRIRVLRFDRASGTWRQD